MDEQRSTPICGDCGYFRPDAQRTGSYRLGWCGKRKEQHDRCDLMPECVDLRLKDERAEKPAREHPHANHFRRVRCIQTGKVYKSITAAANDYGLKTKTLSGAMIHGQGGIKKRTGVEFVYI